MYFLVPWDKSTGLTIENHPQFVNLILFGRNYKFKFIEPFERGR